MVRRAKSRVVKLRIDIAVPCKGEGLDMEKATVHRRLTQLRRELTILFGDKAGEAFDQWLEHTMAEKAEWDLLHPQKG